MKKITTLFTALLFVSAVFTSSQISAQSSCAWAKKASGTNEDFGVSVGTDASGNVYYLGNFYSATVAFGTTVLHNQPAAAFNYGAEMFLVKYDSCGTLKWAKQAGGNDETYGRALAVDPAGNVYVTGYFSADTAIFGAVKLPRTTYTDAFLVKYNTNGIAQWAQCGSGNDQDLAYAIALDPANNILVTGNFASTTLTWGTNSISNGTNDGYTKDAFIAKFDNNGNNLWLVGSTSHSSTNDNVNAFGIGTDAVGDVYVSGNFASTYVRFDTDSLALNGSSNKDIYVVKYDNGGNEVWLKTAGGSSDDGVYALATDASGNSYITGYIGQGSASFGTNNISSNSTNRNVFIAKYDLNGVAQWARAPHTDFYADSYSSGISLDAAGNPYITGTYSSDSLNVGPVTLFNTSYLGGNGGDYFYDVFVAKYKANGNVSWARTAGGDSTDIGNGIATGPHGALYITGEYTSPSISFAGITLTSANSIGDAFIANNIAATTLMPDICEVTTDSLSVNNIVYWDKTMFTTVASFIVYREVNTGIYKPIAVVPFDSLSEYIDVNRAVGPANGDPNVGSYRYKLQTIDTAGCYSPMGYYHNTVYVSTNGTGTFNWNTYDVETSTVPSTPVSQFDLLRDDNNTGVWHSIGTVTGTQTTLNDPNWSTFQTTANWVVEASGFSCTPTRAAINTSRSNIKGARMSSIKTALQDIKTSVYPNPFSNSFTLELGSETNVNYTLEIMNTLGQVLRSMKVTSYRTIVSTEDWAAGVYFYKLYNATSLKAGKINKD